MIILKQLEYSRIPSKTILRTIKKSSGITTKPTKQQVMQLTKDLSKPIAKKISKKAINTVKNKIQKDENSKG